MYFKNWPFRMVPERSAEIWADRKKIFEEMNASFNDTLDKKRSSLICVWGYVGAGKSHSLLHFKTLLGKNGKNAVVYSTLPKEMRRFADLYQQGFFSAINPIFLGKVAADVWTKLNPSGVSLDEEMKAIELVTNEIACDRMDIATVILALGRSIATNKSLKDPIYLFSLAWLSGERLPKKYLSLLGVSANLTDDSDFVKVGSSIIRLLTYKSDKCLEYSSVIWMLDDCHYFTDLKKQSQKNFVAIQQGIRDMFDLCPDNLSLTLSFASSSFSVMKELLVPDLQSRVSRTIQIPPLALEESIEFISDLLCNEKFRSENANDKYYPFTKESLKLTIELISKQGDDLTPRNLMRYFDIITSRAQDEIYPSVITTKFVEDRFPTVPQE